MAQKRDSFFLPDKKQKKANRDGKEEFKKTENKTKQQKQFDKNRNGLQKPKEDGQEGAKKQFDKKAYRLKKYSKKYKLEQYEEQRKKKLLHQYYKSLKDEMSGSYKPKAFDEDTTDSNQQLGKFVRHPDLMDEISKLEQKPKKDPFWKAKEQFKKVKQDKLDRKEQAEKARQERAQKQAEYKKKKQERYKKLSVKNKKGQPVMSGRMELLLDKIQSGSN